MAQELPIRSKAELADAKESHIAFLQSLINRQLRIWTTDGRLFFGTFKCVDNDCNVVLGNAHEYREPSDTALQSAADEAKRENRSKFVSNMTSRYMGLVVILGKHITKIEKEGAGPALF